MAGSSSWYDYLRFGMILWFSSGGGGIGFLLEGILERKYCR
jgi:hypothetical protein